MNLWIKIRTSIWFNLTFKKISIPILKMTLQQLRTWTVFHICLFITFLLSSFIINIIQAVLYVTIGLISKTLYRKINSLLVWQIHAQVIYFLIGIILVCDLWFKIDHNNSECFACFSFYLLEAGGVIATAECIVQKKQ